jgi:hypothetical protein
MYDEVDEFHEQRDEIMMKKAGMRGPDGGDSSDDDDVDGGKQTVMDLNVSDSSSGSDSDSSSSGGGESDSSDDEGGVAGAGKFQPPAQDSDSGDGESSSDDDARAGTTADWGKKRDFYGNDSSDDAEGSEDEELMAREASRLQREEAEGLDAGDYEVSESDGSDDEAAGAGKGAAGVTGDNNKKKKKKRKKKKAMPDEATALKSVNSGLDRIDFQKSGMAVEVIEKKKSRLSEAQKLAIVERDAPELGPLLDDYKAKAKELKEQILPVIRKVKALPKMRLDPSLEHGLAYFETKLHVLLNYCTNLSFYLVLKSSGRSIVGHPVIEQLVKLRTMMEKMKPLDGKLKYQLDKLLQLAASGTAGATATEDISSSARPDLSNLVNADDESGGDTDGSGENGGAAAKEASVYVPPKRMAVQYFADESAAAKASRDDVRRLRRLRQSEMMTELANEFSDKPEMVQQERTGDKRLDREEAERERYEEEYLTRLVVTKKLKKARKAALRKKGMVGSLGQLDNFGKIDMLMNQEGEAEKMERLEWERRRALKNQLNQLEQQQRQGSKRSDALSGDADVLYRDPQDVSRRAQQEMTRKAMMNRPPSDDDDQAGVHNDVLARFSKDPVEDDEFYRSTKRKRSEKLDEKRQKYEFEPTFDDSESDDGSPRKANYMMIKNKGLVAHKKKEYRNPRVRKRKQFERAAKRVKGQVRQVRTGETDRYGGEDTGIRSDLSRSRKIK